MDSTIIPTSHCPAPPLEVAVTGTRRQYRLTMMKLPLIAFLAMALGAVQAQNATGGEADATDPFPPVDQIFDDCDPATYYAGMPGDVSAWDRDTVHALIFGTHRIQVNFTNNLDPGIEDLWGALIDVDAGDEPGTIRLIYSDKETPIFPFGERGWVRKPMFPLLRGVGVFGPDLTDIHNVRAATALSSIVSSDKYFGKCQVLTQPETCVAPAEGSAEDTCSCNRVFEPPASVKGDIARALMYMDLRYDGTEPFTLDLRLTDCPFQPERDMAYLSQMLAWHMEDPPDEREIERNNKVCANWQGNRNPFVDFPDLASVVFEPASPLPESGRLIYEKCEALPTLAPTFEANSCDMYEEGDFVIWLLNTDKPLSLGFYAFAPMEEGFELYVTDNPWDGEKFLEQDGAPDGTIKFVTPAGFERGGKLFGIGLGDDTTQSYESQFEDVEGTLSPSTDGEPIFIYCLSASGAQRPLTVFNNGGTLADPGLEVYAEGESALPDDFPETGIINLPHFNNLLYSGERPDAGASTEELKVAVRDPANWEGSNDSRYGLESSARARSSFIWATSIFAVAVAFIL